MKTEFSIRLSSAVKSTCPICGLEFTAPYLAVHQPDNRPVCFLCAWENAPAFAGLIYLAEGAEGYARGALPAGVGEALTQRKNDPARLKKELQDALDSLDNHGHGAPNTSPIWTSPLAKLVAEQIKAALDSEDVKTMQQTKRLIEECPDNYDSEIPF